MEFSATRFARLWRNVTQVPPIFGCLASMALVLVTACGPPRQARSPEEAEAESLFPKIKSEYRTHDLAWQEWREIEALGEGAAPALIRLLDGSIKVEGQGCSEAEMKIGALNVLGRWEYEPAFELGNVKN